MHGFINEEINSVKNGKIGEFWDVSWNWRDVTQQAVPEMATDSWKHTVTTSLLANHLNTLIPVWMLLWNKHQFGSNNASPQLSVFHCLDCFFWEHPCRGPDVVLPVFTAFIVLCSWYYAFKHFFLEAIIGLPCNITRQDSLVWYYGFQDSRRLPSPVPHSLWFKYTSTHFSQFPNRTTPQFVSQ